VASVENGRYDPSISLAFHIARLFNVTIEEVFEYEGISGEFHGLPSDS
jgi:putative transcriptional regulator